MPKKTPYEKTIELHRRARGKLKFISGKWFYKNDEIRDINRYLYATGQYTGIDEMQKVIDGYITLYGESGAWPPLPIVSNARSLIKSNAGNLEGVNLAYPLNKKQLMIINYLLRHDEDCFFILTGVGGSGKSTFANIICQIFGNDTASLSIRFGQ